jgi:uncharacterized protein (TIGR03083 family)
MMQPPVGAEHDQDWVDRLELAWSSLGGLGAELAEPEWDLGTDVPGWSVRDNLTHVTGIEWWQLGRPRPDHVVEPQPAHVRNELGRRNEVFVDSRRGWSGAAVLAEFVETTAARVAQLRGFGPECFGADSWTPVGPGTVRDFLPFRVFDTWVHEQDIRRAVGRPGHWDGPVADVALSRIIGALGFVVGKRVAAPDGTVVAIDTTGPGARSLDVVVAGGRATVRAGARERHDGGPADARPTPTVALAMSTECFVRLACGRLEPADAWAEGSIVAEGHRTLGATVVEQLNFVP